MKKQLFSFSIIFLYLINTYCLEIDIIDINEFENTYHMVDRLKTDFLDYHFDYERDKIVEFKNRVEIKILQIRNEKKKIYIAVYNDNIELSKLNIYCAIMRFNSFGFLEFYELCKFSEEKIKDMYPTTVIYAQRGDDLLSYNITDKTLQELKTLSLNGAKHAPFYLYEYYTYKNSKSAWYWLQIGAQNGNEKCQYEYGKYLLAKGDKDSKIRGLFWIKKAVFNASKEAYQLLKQIEENGR
ncbi:hypothetical protein [Treponema pedis]|uniref:Sel1 repeat family protein n=3 Tax=Treponema pedis TaxID=409322 RepID=S6A7S7_9SPIR|nr:hypothetical protein [Treponema pedis]AGT42609.1 hypothetical protein TPE_0113 [Treponema pedis str. T A4]QSI03502.1 hypothetical protein DYQ05_00520 [Treponema pedis]